MDKYIIKIAASSIAILYFCQTVSADEGMWLPSLISERITDMQSKGFKLSAEDIYSINQASLKDAVVLFGRGCTGEIISSEGLLLTNHHCGYSQIQKHSSVEHDYLKNGFWAMTRSEELPNEGLTVSFLERMDDVTSRILEGWEVSMTEKQRDSLVKANSTTVTDEATAGGKGLRASVEALYYGNQYFLFVYREFSDVRLVGAPPSSIGKFGGDTDNWMWPRHTGDFSLFRIYADKDNNPAPYSKDNVPYRPKKHFRISIGGVDEGDFTFVYGFPGKTQEYIMSEGVRYISEISDPCKIRLRTERLAIQKKYMEQSDAVRIRYSSKNAGVANAWKKWQGEAGGIRRLKTVEKKKEYEKAFSSWAQGTEYKGLIECLDSLYRILEPWMFDLEICRETAMAVEISEFAMNLHELLTANDTAHLDTCIESSARLFYKDYHLPVDKECFIVLMEAFHEIVPEERQPYYFQEEYAKFGNAAEWAEYLFGNTVFTDSEKTARLEPADTAAISTDPVFIFGKAFREWYDNVLTPEIVIIHKQIALAYRSYMKGQMEFEPDKTFYPDANLTLRVAYGQVAGYSPADGVFYEPLSTLDGIMEKDNPEIFDYDTPQKLRELWKNGDFGKWAVTCKNGRKTVPVCFIATNHTSGGNSGSPVINADGHLIGINFDRVWEGTMSDIDFDPDFCRNISMDIRYMLFIIDKVAGAKHLIEEMDILSPID